MHEVTIVEHKGEKHTASVYRGCLYIDAYPGETYPEELQTKALEELKKNGKA
jgi:hypothetical protein